MGNTIQMVVNNMLSNSMEGSTMPDIINLFMVVKDAMSKMIHNDARDTI